MGEFDPNFARLKIILMIFVFLFFIVSCEYVFFGMSGNEDVLDITQIERTEKPTGLWDGIASIFDGIVAFFTMSFQFITFTLPEIPFWMTAIMSPIMTILVVVEVYLVVDFIYSFVKALPLT